MWIDHACDKFSKPLLQLSKLPEPTTSPVNHFSTLFLSISLKPTQLLENVSLLEINKKIWWSNNLLWHVKIYLQKPWQCVGHESLFAYVPDAFRVNWFVRGWRFICEKYAKLFAFCRLYVDFLTSETLPMRFSLVCPEQPISVPEPHSLS